MHRSILIAAAAALFSLFALHAEARGLHPRCGIDWPCATSTVSKSATVRKFRTVQVNEISGRFVQLPDFPVIKNRHREARRAARAQRLHEAMPFGAPIVPPETQRSFLNRSSGLVAPLAAKLASIQASCPGTVAVSGVRHTRIAGTNRISLHASGKAVDVAGPYGCIYAQLRGWPGGYTTDAGRMRHIHISYDADGGREMGQAFRHGGGRRYARHKAGHHRHARHKRPHYATAHPR